MHSDYALCRCGHIKLNHSQGYACTKAGCKCGCFHKAPITMKPPSGHIPSDLQIAQLLFDTMKLIEENIDLRSPFTPNVLGEDEVEAYWRADAVGPVAKFPGGTTVEGNDLPLEIRLAIDPTSNCLWASLYLLMPLDLIFEERIWGRRGRSGSDDAQFVLALLTQSGVWTKPGVVVAPVYVHTET